MQDYKSTVQRAKGSQPPQITVDDVFPGQLRYVCLFIPGEKCSIEEKQQLDETWQAWTNVQRTVVQLQWPLLTCWDGDKLALVFQKLHQWGGITPLKEAHSPNKIARAPLCVGSLQSNLRQRHRTVFQYKGNKWGHQLLQLRTWLSQVYCLVYIPEGPTQICRGLSQPGGLNSSIMRWSSSFSRQCAVKSTNAGCVGDQKVRQTCSGNFLSVELEQRGVHCRRLVIG